MTFEIEFDVALLPEKLTAMITVREVLSNRNNHPVYPSVDYKERDYNIDTPRILTDSTLHT